MPRSVKRVKRDYLEEARQHYEAALAVNDEFRLRHYIGLGQLAVMLHNAETSTLEEQERNAILREAVRHAELQTQASAKMAGVKVPVGMKSET